MSGPNRPGDIPPDLPPEYVEAYRRGFETAFQRGEQTLDADMPYPYEDLDDERRRWVVPGILAGLALLLILGAYGLGKLVSSSVSETDATPAETGDGVVIGESESPKDTKSTPTKRKKQKAKPYDGEVRTATIGGADASCTSDSSVDASGDKVSY
ncbi:MAG: hypothetical protein ACRDXB_20235, partial [Actinomycetes bacterium]